MPGDEEVKSVRTRGIGQQREAVVTVTIAILNSFRSRPRKASHLWDKPHLVLDLVVVFGDGLLPTLVARATMRQPDPKRKPLKVDITKPRKAGDPAARVNVANLCDELRAAGGAEAREDVEHGAVEPRTDLV